jgi:hypothetical protein
MPAERTSFGALADITVTTSYRGRTLEKIVIRKLVAASIDYQRSGAVQDPSG